MNLSTAIEFATAALAEKVDDKGSPYINHVLRVMERMDTEEEKMAAVLHDVVEDTEITLQDLCDAGFSREVVETVEILTKRLDMTYFDYIDDIHWSETASKIKIAEIEDNLDIMRVKKMSFRTYSTEKRAEMALAILRGENVKNDYK